jgi:uncharacterized protein
MMLVFSAFVCGLIFGLGLIVSQMINPSKVLGFLDVWGDWDPSLALVMAAAVMVSSLGYMVAKRREQPLLGSSLLIPTKKKLDPRLVTGAALFGLGWGLVGLCPGPAIAILPLARWQAVVFVGAMLAGMLLIRFINGRRSRLVSSEFPAKAEWRGSC